MILTLTYILKLFIALISSYYLFIFSFIYYIYLLSLSYSHNKTYNNKFYYNSIIKDKEYLNFKINLFNFYYSTIITLIYFLFKNNGLQLALDLNIKFIYLLLTIFLIYSILLSNYFIFKLFNLFNLIKKNINLFNNINWINLSQFLINNNNKRFVNKFKGVRNYSTFTENIVKLGDNNSNETKNKYKKTNREGYLGYNTVHNLGNVAYMINATEPYFVELCINDLSQGLKLYLNDLPENTTFSVLPVLQIQTNHN